MRGSSDSLIYTFLFSFYIREIIMLTELPGTFKNTRIQIVRNAIGRAIAYVLRNTSIEKAEATHVTMLNTQDGPPNPPNGFATEDLIVIAKSRLEELNSAIPSAYNEIAINHLKLALNSLGKRQEITERREVSIDNVMYHIFATATISGKEFHVARYGSHMYIGDCYMALWRNINTANVARYEDFAGLETYLEYDGGREPLLYYSRGEMKMFINLHPRRKKGVNK